MKRILEIGIFLFILASCTLNERQEQAFSDQRSQYVNALNEGSVLVAVSMTYPGYVAEVKQKGAAHFKTVFADRSEEMQVGSQVIRKTVKSGNDIHILFDADIQYTDGKRGQKQFAGISSDNGASWFFLNYDDYKNRQNCKGLKRLIR